MKAGDIKKCLDKIISSNDNSSINPKDFNIHDNFLLNAFNAFRKGGSGEHIATLIDAAITTEELTVHRRVAVLKMVKDVLVEMANKSDLSEDEKNRMRSILTAYFV